MASVTTELMNGRAPANDHGVECYMALTRAVGYPRLVKLCHEKKIASDQVKASFVNILASTVIKILTPYDYQRHAAKFEVKRSVFGKYTKLRRRGSPKYEYLSGRMKEMVQTGPREHRLIHTLNPVTCLVTPMLLLQDFPELRMVYHHAWVPPPCFQGASRLSPNGF